MGIFLTIYLIIALITFLIEGIAQQSNIDNVIITPNDIYETTKLNRFGCWFFYILLSICSPIMFIFKWLVVIGFALWDGIKWLFTVGRK